MASFALKKSLADTQKCYEEIPHYIRNDSREKIC